MGFDFYVIDEATIEYICENAPVTVDGDKWYVVPSIKGTDDTREKHGPRVKVTKKKGKSNNTMSHADTVTIPIDPNTKHVRYDKIRYGRNIKEIEKKEYCDIGVGIGYYCFDELIEMYNHGTTQNLKKFNDKAKIFGSLDKKERKKQIKRGYGEED